MRQTINLKAGIEVSLDYAGTLFLVVSTGVAATIAVRLFDGTEELESIDTAGRGFKARMLDGAVFTRIAVKSTVDTAAQVIISRQNIDFDFLTGAQVQATIVGLPLAVSNDRGAPASPIYVAGITNLADAPATSMVDRAPVACSAAPAVLLAANTARKAARFCNIGADPVAIGSAGITWASRCLVLSPGDIWIEERSANLAWSGVTDAAKAASVTVQEVFA